MSSTDTAPSITTIRDFLQQTDVGHDLRWDDEIDGLTFDDSVLYPEAIAANWDSITPDDNDGAITDPTAMVVMGAVQSEALWVEHTYVLLGSDGWSKVVAGHHGQDTWRHSEPISASDGQALAGTGTEAAPRYGSARTWVLRRWNQ